jgi:hypothetical protein
MSTARWMQVFGVAALAASCGGTVESSNEPAGAGGQGGASDAGKGGAGAGRNRRNQA